MSEEVNNLGKILCPFCSAPWSERNLLAYDLDAGDHCDSGRFYEECCTLEIVCDSCGKTMYRKDGFGLSYSNTRWGRNNGY